MRWEAGGWEQDTIRRCLWKSRPEVTAAQIRPGTGALEKQVRDVLGRSGQWHVLVVWLRGMREQEARVLLGFGLNWVNSSTGLR